MNISGITGYLINLERSGFTGQVTLNFHKGDLSDKIKEQISKELSKETLCCSEKV